MSPSHYVLAFLERRLTHDNLLHEFNYERIATQRRWRGRIEKNGDIVLKGHGQVTIEEHSWTLTIRRTEAIASNNTLCGIKYNVNLRSTPPSTPTPAPILGRARSAPSSAPSALPSSVAPLAPPAAPTTATGSPVSAPAPASVERCTAELAIIVAVIPFVLVSIRRI